MYIGEVSRLSGASAKAIRHYEAMGLLGRVQRAGTYRCYEQDDVERIGLIRQALALGLRLAELQPVLVQGAPEPDWERLRLLIVAKREALARERARLQQLDLQLAAIDAEIGACLTRRSEAKDMRASCSEA